MKFATVWPRSELLPLILLIAAAATHCVLLLVYVHFGPVYLDAGFYLSASDLVYHGKLPYLDFFYVQMPVYPYIYGIPALLFGTGIFVARWTSLAFALAAFVLTVRSAWRVGGLNAGCICAILLGMNGFHAYCMSVTKLYALSAFWSAASLYFLTRSPRLLPSCAAAICLTLGVSTRLTLLPALAVLLLFLIWRDRWRAWPSVTAAGVTGLIIMVPFLILAPEQAYFNLFGIHTSADAGPHVHGLIGKAGVVSALIRDHFLAFILLIFTVCTVASRVKLNGGHRGEIVAIGGMALSVTAAHFTANWFDASYQSIVFPLFAWLIAYSTATVLSSVIVPNWRSVLLLTIFLAGLATPVAYGGRSLVRSEGLNVLQQLSRIGDFINSQTDPEASLITCNAFFTYSASRKPLAGFEGAPFTYTPAWPVEQCSKYHTVNDELMVAAVRAQSAGAIIIYHDSFAVGFPGFYPVTEARQRALFDEIEQNYALAGTFPNVLGGEDPLLIYLPKRRGK